MAASKKDPRRWKLLALQRGLGSSRPGAPKPLSSSGKYLNSRWPFPMGQRPQAAFKNTSSYLLQELIQHAQETEAEEQLQEGESEESSESEMPNLEEEFDGILREEAVAKALHELGRSGPGTEQVYLNLNLSDCDLIDISILCEYVHLQKLNLSNNKIEDLSCVSCMPYLLELNASQNKLTTFFNFKPPKNLKKVDFSSNQISEMGDLSAYHTLTQLILDNNEIEEISGLEMCISLTHLSLTNNKITTISGLNSLPIKILCLSNNQIEVITGLENLKALQNLDLSHNQISSLQGLENHDLLEVINLEDNKIAELGEIEYIENLPILRILNLLRNPIQEKSEYWLFVIFMLLRLTELDQKKIRVEEKVSAVNKYDPPPDVVAAQDHMTHVVNSMMQPQRIFDSTLPSLDAPYPMLILVGPQACGKRELAHRLCRQFSTYFRYGACHTTRPPYFGEGDRVDYHFISQEVFDEMLSMGKFILTFKYGNHSYGLNRDTVEGIARDGLASCIHMEIEGVRSLKYSYFEPRYILVVPMNKEKYEGYLRRKGLFSRAEIEFAVSRVDLYIKINQKFPGYFDAVINADDLDAAYQKLSELIREYLGLTEEPAKTLAPTAAGAPSSKKTISGVPAHLVPSPRRLAKLQADGPITEHLSEGQIHTKAPENQNPAPSQSQELSEEGEPPKKELSPNSHHDSEPPQQLISSTLDIPQQAQDIFQKAKEDDSQPADLPPNIITTEDEAQPPEVMADEVGQSSTTASQAPPRHPDPPPQLSPQPDQDKESGETKAAHSGPSLSDSSQGPDPTSLNTQRVQDEETKSGKLPPSSSQSDTVKKPAGSSPPPPEEEPSKTKAVRASTPYPKLPPPQDSSTNTKQTQDREQPVALLPKSRLAPTRLPQPQTLAPLQSRRPTPKLLSPSREEAVGTSLDQNTTPSPRSLPTQEGDPSKLPPISPPHSKPPPNSSPQASQSPQQAKEGKSNEVKLPLISPPLQEQASQNTPNPYREEEAPIVRLPGIPTPFTDSHLQPAKKEKKTPKVGHSSSKKILDMQASPHGQEPAQQKGARKKKLPMQREVAKGPAHLKKGPPQISQVALQPESHSKPASTKMPNPPDPAPPLSPQGDLKPQAHTEPLPKDPQEKRGKSLHTKKKPQTNLTPKDLSQNVGASKREPSVKEGLTQESETALSGDQPTQEDQPLQAPGQGQDASAPPVVHPGRREQVHKKGRSLKREVVVEPLQQESVTLTQQPAKDTQAYKGAGQASEGSVQKHNTLASKQQTKEKRTQKTGGMPQDQSPSAPKNEVSGEEKSSRIGRLRARGSQSTKV